MTRMRIALIASGLLIGCATVDVRTDWDRAVDFSSFETFALLAGEGVFMVMSHRVRGSRPHASSDGATA